MSSVWKKLLTTLFWFILIVLCIAVLAYLNAGSDADFMATLLRTTRQTLLVLAIILFVWYIFFFPPIFILRRWWKKKQSSNIFSNPQTPRIINRFIRNTAAMFGLITLLYAVFIFITAHLIAPDPTPYAGFQVNEIAYKPPGFRVKMLEVPLQRTPASSHFFSRVISGKQLSYRLIPIKKYWFAADTLYVERFLDAHVQGDVMAFSLQSITGNSAVSVEENQANIEKHKIYTKHYWFGTDDLGRDYLSRVILGVRVSLAVGFIAVIIALLIGVPIGAAAGFYKREPPQTFFRKKKIQIPVDGLLMWLMSVIWAIPALLLVFPIVFAFGQQFYTIFIAVGLTMWVDIARMVRGQVMQVRELEYITATKNFGYSGSRTIFKHILPNITGPVIVITTANFAYAILTEAGLSFLGIGVQPPAPSWGLMISKYKDYLITNPHLALIPGFAITLLVLAFFMVGNGLRDALDIKSQ